MLTWKRENKKFTLPPPMQSCRLLTRASRIAQLRQVCRDLIENCWIVDGRRQPIVDSVGNLLDGTTQNLARAGLGQPLNNYRDFEGRHRADPIAYHLDHFRNDLAVRTMHSGFEDDQAHWNFSLDWVGYSHNRTFGDVGMRRQHLFHRTGGQTMAGDIDDVVRTAHDPEVAILIFVTCIRSQVVARITAQIRLLKTFVVVPQSGKTTVRQRQLDNDVADLTSR